MDNKQLIETIRSRFQIAASDSVMLKRWAVKIASDPSDPGDRTFTALASTADVDEDNEVLLSTGCDASRFLRSGSILYEHDRNKIIGRPLSVDRKTRAVLVRAEFAERPQNHVGAWLADEVMGLVKTGSLRGVSVGFIPVEVRKPTAADVKLYGPTVERVVAKWKLLELSITPIPCNPNAVIVSAPKSTTATAEKAVRRPKERVYVLPGGEDQAEQAAKAILKRRGVVYASDELIAETRKKILDGLPLVG